MSILTSIETELHTVWSKLQAEGHALAADVKNVLDKLKGDAPQLEAEVAGDAATVVKDAETEGVKPAVAEAVADAAKVGAEAVHDVETAVTEAAPTPAATPASETPAAPSA